MIMNVGSEECPEITIYDIQYAQSKMNKALGEDRITDEMLKMEGKNVLKTLLNPCLIRRKNTQQVEKLFCCLTLYKPFSRIITNSITELQQNRILSKGREAVTMGDQDIDHYTRCG